MMNYNYYVVLADTTLHEKLGKLYGWIDSANLITDMWTQSYFGEVRRWAQSQHCIGGGIVAVRADERPRGFVLYPDVMSPKPYWRPKELNRTTRAAWEQMPIVTSWGLNNILEYTASMLHPYPNFVYRQGVYAFKIIDKYEPIDGLLSITMEQYTALALKEQGMKHDSGLPV